jgi:hypothetical protein
MIEPDRTTHTELVQLDRTQVGHYLNPHPTLARVSQHYGQPPSSIIMPQDLDWTTTATNLDVALPDPTWGRDTLSSSSPRYGDSLPHHISGLRCRHQR